MLDVTFGNGGKVVTPVNDTSTANDVAIQPDGKIVVGGSSTLSGTRYFTLVRYNTDGSLDNSFGSGGKVINQIGILSAVNHIALRSDGKIIAGGYSSYNRQSNSTIDFGSHAFTIARYNNNGNLDSTFGKNGTDTTVMIQGWGEIKKLLIKPDGKILTAGVISRPTFDYLPGLAQFKPNGSLDSLFGNNGKVEGSRYLNDITDVELGKDGKIYAIGNSSSYMNGDFVMVRLLPNGMMDGTFGTNGAVITDMGNAYYREELATGLLILPDSSIVLAGYTGQGTSFNTFALAKYKVNGTLDSTFGTVGKVTTQISNLHAYATNVVADSAGRLIVSGYTYSASQQDFLMARYLANGKLDSTFGSNGVVTTDFAGFRDQAFASALQSDGKIVLAGQAGSSDSKYSIALARYSMTVLPLKLLSITAKKDGKTNLLQWTTTQEINIDRFEIERSLNGKDYSNIGKMNGGLSKYNFTDEKPFTGINYYRIKMIDKDGKFEYSPVRIINNSGSFYVHVYPLPAKGRLNIQVQSNKTEKADILVTTISGKTILTNPVLLAAGVNNTFINLQSFSKGAYFLKIVTSQTTETRKIIVE
jgi:uncharacterized delta-60 repeat protein